MEPSIVYTRLFEKEFKKLSAKHLSLRADFKSFLSILEENPFQGTPLGNDCYKIRLAISSKAKGKSGGARVITCVKIVANKIFLVAIYDKSEKEAISNKELRERIKPFSDE
jgi:mRNA-degrading endonuclease RelE of RelBE toxin-antitoxin system